MKSDHGAEKEKKRPNFSSVNRFRRILFFFPLAFLLFTAGCSSHDVSNVTMMAVAGPDRQVFVGRKVWLDGGDSYHTAGKALTGFEWIFVEKPQQSLAVIEQDGSPLGSVVPDVPGVYTLQLTVSDGTNVSEPDEVVLDARYRNSALVPVNTRLVRDTGVQRSDYAIQVGEALYAAPADDDAPEKDITGFHLLVLDQKTLVPLIHRSCIVGTDQEWADFTQALADAYDNCAGSGGLFILSSLGDLPNLNATWAADIDMILGWMGRAEGVSGLVGHREYVYNFIGVPGLSKGQAFEWMSGDHVVGVHADSVNAIRGFVTRDMNGNFQFTYPVVAFASDHGDRSLHVGGKVYPAPVPGGSVPVGKGGVHVLVLKRDTLEELNNLFYGTNMASDQGIAFNGLASSLWQTASTRDERRLVFLSTVGVPFMPDALGNYIQGSLMNLEKAVNWLGGTEYTVQQVLETPGTDADPTGYALLGVPVPKDFPLSHNRVRLGTVTESDGVALASVETSTLAVKASRGNVRGLLQRNRQGWYRPFLYDGGFSYVDGQGGLGGIDYSLPLILFQDPVPWVDPASPGQWAAYRWISRYVYDAWMGEEAQEDIRVAYDNWSDSWDNVKSTLEGTLIEQDVQEYLNSHPDFDYAGDFIPVRRQFRDEVTAVVDVRNFLRHDLGEFFTTLQGQETSGLMSFYSDIYQRLDISKDTNIGMKILNGVLTALSVAAMVVPLLGEEAAVTSTEEAPVPEGAGTALLGAILGATSAVLAYGSGFIPSSSTAQKEMGKVEAAVSQFWTAFGTQFLTADFMRLKAYELIVSDWGKLQAARDSIGRWWVPDYQDEAIRLMTRGFKAQIYKTLLPVLNEIEPMFGSDYSTPKDYCWCQGGGHNCDHQKVAEPNYWKVSTMAWNENGLSNDFYTIWSQHKSWSSGHSFLPAETLSDLFDPFDTALEDSPLGLYKAEFFTRWFSPDRYVLPDHYDYACK